jgi:hypothetical protein
VISAHIHQSCLYCVGFAPEGSSFWLLSLGILLLEGG